MPASHPPLAGDTVHVWRIELSQPGERIAWLRELLSADESERADRFRFPQDRERYTVAHGVLRLLLGRYLERDPADLRFDLGAHGKPSLQVMSQPCFDRFAIDISPHLRAPLRAGKGLGRGPVPAQFNADRLLGPDLRFNLSHSGELALIAVASGREVGVDVERIRPDVADEQIAERYFSPGEVTALRAVATEDRSEAFFRCWTRKEAFLKADGRGISRGLDTFDVSLAAGDAALIRTAPDPEEVTRWNLRPLDPARGYVGAVCAAGQGWALEMFGWLLDGEGLSGTREMCLSG